MESNHLSQYTDQKESQYRDQKEKKSTCESNDRHKER